MLTWMGDNWVIYRGAWTAKHILDDPPQLPPLEVPELDPTAGDNKHKTTRELMIQHREDPKCNGLSYQIGPDRLCLSEFRSERALARHGTCVLPSGRARRER